MFYTVREHYLINSSISEDKDSNVRINVGNSWSYNQDGLLYVSNSMSKT